MARGIWEKIEWVREQPEHIRMRYVVVCLLLSMTFIFGIWLLSLKESLQTVRRDVPAAADQRKELFPRGEVPSIGGLLDQTIPFGTEGQEGKSGQEYFEEQFRAEPGSSAENENPAGSQ